MHASMRRRQPGKSITVDEARQNLFSLIEQVIEDHVPVHITSRKGNAVLMSGEDVSSWTKTPHLLRSPRTPAVCSTPSRRHRPADPVSRVGER
ncbi:hypothetical protein GCM10020256_53310 [Streptomyces thermocoprophilus]